MSLWDKYMYILGHLLNWSLFVLKTKGCLVFCFAFACLSIILISCYFMFLRIRHVKTPPFLHYFDPYCHINLRCVLSMPYFKEIHELRRVFPFHVSIQRYSTLAPELALQFRESVTPFNNLFNSRLSFKDASSDVDFNCHKHCWGQYCQCGTCH